MNTAEKRNEARAAKAALKDAGISTNGVIHTGDDIIIYTPEYIRDGTPKHLDIIRIVQKATGRNGRTGYDHIASMNGGITICEKW